MICRNCNAEIQDYSQVCPYCGFNFTQQQQQGQQQQMQQNTFGQNSMFDNQNTSFNNQYQTHNCQQNCPPKKKKGCLIAIIVVLVILGLFFGAFVAGGSLLFKIGKDVIEQLPEEGITVEFGNSFGTDFDAEFEEMKEEMDVFMDELDSLSKGEEVEDTEEIIEEEEVVVEDTSEDYQFKDSDGDGVLDTDIFE